MAPDPFDTLEQTDAGRCLLWRDRASGLRAVVVIDDVTLGPAAGGVRTAAYERFEDALADAARLARAMTIKCALAGLDAGGGKGVVIDHPGLDRERAFEVLGERVEELGGLFRTAGDLGTTEQDLQAMARRTRYVHTGADHLGDAVARGLIRCIEAAVESDPGGGGLQGRRIAVQGCGVIGAAVAQRLTKAGARVVICDVDVQRAEEVARSIGATLLPPDQFWDAEADVLAPCAGGGVLDAAVAERIRASAVCGAANNLLADPAVATRLAERDVLLVPDTIASAGAVVDGIARTVMGVQDPAPLVDRLGDTARRVLEQARRSGRPTPAIAEELALRRIADARADAPTG